MGSIVSSFACLWCSVFRCTLFIEKPDTTPERCALVIVGTLTTGVGAVGAVGAGAGGGDCVATGAASTLNK